MRLKLCGLKAKGEKQPHILVHGISNFWLIYNPFKAHAIKQLKTPVAVLV